MYLDTDLFYDDDKFTLRENKQEINVRKIDNIPFNLTIRFSKPQSNDSGKKATEQHVYNFPIQTLKYKIHLILKMRCFI